MDDLFRTSDYMILEALMNNTVNVGDKTYCPLGQEDIGIITGLSRPTVRKCYADLENNGYIHIIARGQIQITDKGRRAVRGAVVERE